MGVPWSISQVWSKLEKNVQDQAFKTELEAKVFANMVELSDNLNPNNVTKKTPLIEQSFQLLNPVHQDYVTTKTLIKLTEQRVDEAQKFSLLGFLDILAENMKN